MPLWLAGILQAADILSKGIAQMIPTLISACIVIISVSKLTKPSHITHQCERTNMAGFRGG
ncbi:hypothetical protein [Siminovitchia sp. FSL W7-1587]|uniref:hypothetical protein n=1 Tax=Siminovitchia sp. FSL W7-1587 TaxID=2954699 RepID=UPI0030D4ADBE